jgi:hypothetical protein
MVCIPTGDVVIDEENQIKRHRYYSKVFESKTHTTEFIRYIYYSLKDKNEVRLFFGAYVAMRMCIKTDKSSVTIAYKCIYDVYKSLEIEF